MKTALVIGATGLVGHSLVKKLLNDDRFSKVVVFVRRLSGFSAGNLVQHIIEFDQPEKWQHLVKGDVLFSTLGTTRKKAGSKEAQYKVDHGYQYQFAAAAAENGVKDYVLVSAQGASPDSFFFYNRMKGELERDVKKLRFSRLVILKPGMLDGDRQEHRTGERTTLAAIKSINKIGLLKSLKPIMDYQVAQAMINSVFLEKSGTMVFQGKELFELAAR